MMNKNSVHLERVMKVRKNIYIYIYTLRDSTSRTPYSRAYIPTSLAASKSRKSFQALFWGVSEIGCNIPPDCNFTGKKWKYDDEQADIEVPASLTSRNMMMNQIKQQLFC